jgi:hypothetical protein
MKLLILILIQTLIYIDACARSSIETSFIKSFIINEGKPTIPILDNLCWDICNYL